MSASEGNCLTQRDITSGDVVCFRSEPSKRTTQEKIKASEICAMTDVLGFARTWAVFLSLSSGYRGAYQVESRFNPAVLQSITEAEGRACWLLSISNLVYHAGEEDKPFILFLVGKTNPRHSSRQALTLHPFPVCFRDKPRVHSLGQRHNILHVRVLGLGGCKKDWFEDDKWQPQRVVALRGSLTFRHLLMCNFTPKWQLFGHH